MKDSKGFRFDHIPGGHSFTRLHHVTQNPLRVKSSIHEKNEPVH